MRRWSRQRLRLLLLSLMTLATCCFLHVKIGQVSLNQGTHVGIHQQYIYWNSGQDNFERNIQIKINESVLQDKQTQSTNLMTIATIPTSTKITINRTLKQKNFTKELKVLSSSTVPLEKDFYAKQPTRVNTYNYNITMQPHSICESSDMQNPFLLILVLSHYDNKIRRDAIRETWGQMKNKTIKIVFILGKTNKINKLEEVTKEKDKHKDIIQYDIQEQYKNLVVKTQLSLKWALQYCSNATFVMKTDDDMLIHIDHLVISLRNMNTSGLLTGACSGGSRVLRGGRWRLNKQDYPFKYLPMYCPGAGYIMSMDIVEKLHDTSQYVPFIPLEDVYTTGIVAKIAGVEAKPSPGFAMWTTRFQNSCKLIKGELHTVHGLTPEKMKVAWHEIKTKKCP